MVSVGVNVMVNRIVMRAIKLIVVMNCVVDWDMIDVVGIVMGIGGGGKG